MVDRDVGLSRRLECGAADAAVADAADGFATGVGSAHASAAQHSRPVVPGVARAAVLDLGHEAEVEGAAGLRGQAQRERKVVASVPRVLVEHAEEDLRHHRELVLPDRACRHLADGAGVVGDGLAAVPQLLGKLRRRDHRRVELLCEQVEVHGEVAVRRDFAATLPAVHRAAVPVDEELRDRAVVARGHARGQHRREGAGAGRRRRHHVEQQHERLARALLAVAKSHGGRALRQVGVEGGEHGRARAGAAGRGGSAGGPPVGDKTVDGPAGRRLRKVLAVARHRLRERRAGDERLEEAVHIAVGAQVGEPERQQRRRRVVEFEFGHLKRMECSRSYLIPHMGFQLSSTGSHSSMLCRSSETPYGLGLPAR